MAPAINNAADSKIGLQNTKAIIGITNMTYQSTAAADVPPLTDVVEILMRGDQAADAVQRKTERVIRSTVGC
jgi:hypothetical protein